MRREKKPLEQPRRERAMYLEELRGGSAMLISPRAMSREGQPSSERRRWAVSNASAKAWGPATGFLAYLQQRWMLMTTRVGSPKRGTSSKLSATSHDIFLVDPWALHSTLCGLRTAMHCVSSNTKM